ncbi:MAG TPA: FAD-binding oxidoreductase [Thermoplasmata archaeon]|jgi:sarcosine oxidase subunit beta|nr:FAD-binding oxidoreductase [Thermoplasmata archaeon]
MTFARDGYRTVVVGAGIVGLFTAYHLAREGGGPVLVVDRGFLSSGSSGRNGGGVRQQWETRGTVRLAREAVQAYRRFGREFGFNIWFRQTGYLFLAENEAELARLRGVHALVASEGLASKVLDADGVARLVEGIAPGAVVGGTYLGSDGTLYPFPAIWGVYEAAKSLGVDIALGVEALSPEVRDGRVAGLRTSKGTVRAPTVVNAAGGWSGDFSRRSGLDVPNVATRHEILATEATKPFLDPMVVRASDGLYFSQSMRGEVIGGVALPHRPGTARGQGSSTAFLGAMARALVGLLPRLGALGVLRAWSGFYDDTPDGFPVIGEDPRLPGFVHGNGFGGHGFMLAPATSRRVALAALGQRTDLDPAQFSPARFLGAVAPAAAERLQLG